MSASLTPDTVATIAKQLEALAASYSTARGGVDQWVEEPSTHDWLTLFKVVEDDSTLHFRMEKTFASTTKTAAQALDTMWDNERKLSFSYRADEDAKRQSLRLVQAINDDAYVFERDMTSPLTGRQAATAIVRMRQPGAIGASTVSASDENVWANEMKLWTEFKELASGQGYAVAISGHVNLDDPKNTQRTIAGVQHGLHKWEDITI